MIHDSTREVGLLKLLKGLGMLGDVKLMIELELLIGIELLTVFRVTGKIKSWSPCRSPRPKKPLQARQNLVSLPGWGLTCPGRPSPHHSLP
jgi:hypothetical protein